MKIMLRAQRVSLVQLYDSSEASVIKHINPLMFDMIDDKPEGFIMYKHEPVGRGFIHYHVNYRWVPTLTFRACMLVLLRESCTVKLA